MGIKLGIFAVLLLGVVALPIVAQADPCMAAVYDEQGPNTIVHFASGTWDKTRSICMGAIDYSRTELKGVTATEAARRNPLVYVVYVIDRNRNRFYAPCGAVVNSDRVTGGLLAPGTYALDDFRRLSSGFPDFGPGGRCGITGI